MRGPSDIRRPGRQDGRRPDRPHIRSEKTNGPRHDATFVGDIDGPDNLLLLCGKHHKPVDDHQSIYPINELEGWKTAQVARAGDGTVISDADARRFTGLTSEEREAITALARLTTRLVSACTKARNDLNRIEVERQEAIRKAQISFGPIYAVHDDGSQTLITSGIQLSHVEETAWRAKADASLAVHRPAITAALDTMAEEVAVLRMMSPSLGMPANIVLLTAEGAGMHVGSEAALDTSLASMNSALRDLWLAANPDS